MGYARTVSRLPTDFTLLQVIPELETGGAEQTTLDVARAVIRAGGRALVASRGGRMAARLAVDGAELITLPAQSKNPVVMLANTNRLIEVIRREKVSLVHARSRAPAFSALQAARATDTPFVATYHGVYNARSAVKRWYNGVMTRGDVVIANSEFTRQHVISEHHMAPDKVVAIPRGVDLSVFEPASVPADRVAALAERWGIAADDARVRLLLAGRLTRWKGQVLLIEAVARVKAAGGPIPLVLLVGDDQGRADYRAELEALIARHDLEGSVRLVGHCDDMPAAYLLADIACAPSLDPEAFGRTAVEPQIMGRPVLAADHGAARETVVDGETGWLVKPGDIDAWARAVGHALTLAPAARDAMGHVAARRARRLYSVDAMCEATLGVYARVLEAKA